MLYIYTYIYAIYIYIYKFIHTLTQTNTHLQAFIHNIYYAYVCLHINTRTYKEIYIHWKSSHKNKKVWTSFYQKYFSWQNALNGLIFSCEQTFIWFLFLCFGKANHGVDTMQLLRIAPFEIISHENTKRFELSHWSRFEQICIDLKISLWSSHDVQELIRTNYVYSLFGGSWLLDEPTKLMEINKNFRVFLHQFQTVNLNMQLGAPEIISMIQSERPIIPNIY